MEAPKLELLNDTSICSVDSLELDGGIEFIEWHWNDGSTDQYKMVNTPGEYFVRVSDGCVWMADTMQLVMNPTPVVASIDTSIFAQVVLYPSGGTEPYRYAVNDGYFQDENVFRDLENGEHIFTVEDANNCMATDTVTIYDNLDVEVPNFFTPNGDGYNDTWIVTGLERLPESEVRIYDRFGKLLVKYKISDQGWDGKYLGQPVRSDDYWYVIELNPTKKIIKGNLTLKR
jgi:gliding motility-associated-like protein